MSALSFRKTGLPRPIPATFLPAPLRTRTRSLDSRARQIDDRRLDSRENHHVTSAIAIFSPRCSAFSPLSHPHRISNSKYLRPVSGLYKIDRPLLIFM